MAVAVAVAGVGLAVAVAFAAMLSTPQTKRSIIEEQEEELSRSNEASRKRQRNQVGRNQGDIAILNAIKIHFGKKISEGELYNNIRNGLSLYYQVEKDWNEKTDKGKAKFSQGYWPALKTTYRCAVDSRDEVEKAHCPILKIVFSNIFLIF